MTLMYPRHCTLGIVPCRRFSPWACFSQYGPITVVNILHSVNSLALYTVAQGSVGVSSVWSCCTMHEVQLAEHSVV